MRADPEGRKILLEKPRVNSETWNLERLQALPEGTFGHEYAFFMLSHGFTSDERPVVKYVPNLEHAYILQRYKEVHDVAHVLLNYGTSVSQELAVKWFEMIQTGLPMSALAALVGPANLMLVERDPKEAAKLMGTYLPHIIQNAKTSKMYLNVHYESKFEMNLNDLRKELNIRPLVR